MRTAALTLAVGLAATACAADGDVSLPIPVSATTTAVAQSGDTTSLPVATLEPGDHEFTITSAVASGSTSSTFLRGWVTRRPRRWLGAAAQGADRVGLDHRP